MDNFDKMAGRGGAFVLNTGDNTASGMQNVIGAEPGYWGFMALESGSTLSTIFDGGATAFSSGTSGTNYGLNVTAAYVWPLNVIIPASTMQGFTQLVCASGSFLVYRMKSASNIEPNMD